MLVPSFRSLDDVEIAYYRWGPAAGRPLVLHHGFITNTQHSWEERGVVATLVSAGHHVVALDARGHGRSAKPHDPGRYGESTMAGDLITLLDILGAPEVDVVGYSMGAVVALIAALRDRRIGRLAIGGVGPATVTELTDDDHHATRCRVLAGALRAADPSTITGVRARRFRTFADYVGGDRLALAAQAEALHHEPVPVGLITVPILILAGDADPITDRAQELAAAMPRATLRMLPGDHLGVPASAAFAVALVEFFRRC
jgi:pimeloyl-ACP methyl ester carboxylesterase